MKALVACLLTLKFLLLASSALGQESAKTDDQKPADPDTGESTQEGLTVAEKRAILASWASDAAAVNSCPSLRAIPGQRQPVTIDEILEALSRLDHQPPGGKPVRRRSISRVPAAA
jgi:hypothetical protein